MKKFLVVLLAVGLLAGFAATASALDVKFSGQYYIYGIYENNRSLANTDTTYSRAFFYNRTRIKTDFKVAEGLSFTTRFDALEKQWGNTNWSGGSTDNSNSRVNTNAGVKIQENIEFEQGYVTFNTMAGTVAVGYMDAGVWGTGFNNGPCSRPRISLQKAFGPFTVVAIYEKNFEAAADTNLAGRVDADVDSYYLGGIYKWKGGHGGLLYTYFSDSFNRDNATHTLANPYKTGTHKLAPYMQATFGPVFVEAEFVYEFGKVKKYEAPSTTADVDKESVGAYLNAKMNLGPAYVGGRYIYSAGDDGSDATKSKTGPATSTGLTPALIFGNSNVGIMANETGATTNYAKTNLHMFGLYGGYNPTPKTNLEMTFSYMRADKYNATHDQSKNYGMELDLTASYKIYDNLTYMVGAGYLWTGDWYKGTNANATTGNDYLVMNSLTLNF